MSQSPRELKPCPFCGKDAAILRPINYDLTGINEHTKHFAECKKHVIECTGCGGFFHMGGIESVPDVVVYRWNQRATQ